MPRIIAARSFMLILAAPAICAALGPRGVPEATARGGGTGLPILASARRTAGAHGASAGAFASMPRQIVGSLIDLAVLLGGTPLKNWPSTRSDRA